MDVKGLTVDEIKELSWVQCENEACLKWRRISREEVNRLEDKSWFCHMNTDPSYNKCQVPEEDHRQTIHTANKCGYRYVFSQLPQGSLVWAKMAGYVSWPAILSPDPTDGSYMGTSEDTGTPSEYHVEFLGQQRSHHWVLSGNIDVYGNSSSAPPNKMPKQGKKKPLCAQSKPKEGGRLTKKLQASIDEAETLKTLSCEERLTKCIFKYKGAEDEEEKSLQPNKTDHTVTEEKAVASGSSADVNTGNQTGKKKRGRPMKCQRDCSACDADSRAQTPKKSKKVVSFRSQPDVRLLPHDDLSNTSSESSGESLAIKEAQMFIRTKEERLQADIQLLRRAEEKFDRRLGKFSIRHGIPVKKGGPQWQGRQVSKYQVYMAVQERGGYNMVSANRAWAKVYHEVCGTTQGPGQSLGSSAKAYYTRTLLPYELHELRSSGSCAMRSMPFEVKHNKHKKHKKHSRRKKLENNRPKATFTLPPTSMGAHYHEVPNPPITAPAPNYGPITELGQAHQPMIGHVPVSFQPMGRADGFQQPITEPYPVHPVSKGQDVSERAQTGSQGDQGALQPIRNANIAGSDSDVDFPQEESTQALQELEAMEEMLRSSINQDEGAPSTGPLKDAFIGLDRATHVEAMTDAQDLLSSKTKPVLLEFYSLQYDNTGCTPPPSVAERVRDDSHRVPDITYPTSLTPVNASSSSVPAHLPVRPWDSVGQDEGLAEVPPDAYSKILLDMDAMGDEIDRLTGELHLDLLEM